MLNVAGREFHLAWRWRRTPRWRRGLDRGMGQGVAAPRTNRRAVND